MQSKSWFFDLSRIKNVIASMKILRVWDLVFGEVKSSEVRQEAEP